MAEENVVVAEEAVTEDKQALAGIDFVNPGGAEAEGEPEPPKETAEAAAPAAPEAPGAPDLTAEREQIREDLRREFQSQKDREIHRERLKWEEEQRALEFQRSLENLPDAEVARRVREAERERVAVAKARIDALSETYAEIGKAMEKTPELKDLGEADWAALMRQGSFGEFLATAMDRGVARRFGEQMEKRATELAEAKFRERMAAIRPGETSPDLTPAAGPSPTFENLESRYLAGELSLADYTEARRRRGLEVY